MERRHGMCVCNMIGFIDGKIERVSNASLRSKTGDGAVDFMAGVSIGFATHVDCDSMGMIFYYGLPYGLYGVSEMFVM